MHQAKPIESGAGDHHGQSVCIALDGQFASVVPVWERPMAPLRILIADAHEVVRLGVRALIESHHDWSVCAEASDGRDAVEKARKLRPDVVILDATLPGLDGIDATRQIRMAAPKTEVLILTIDSSEKRAREALAAGVRGYLLKSDAVRDITSAVEAVAQHKPFFTPRLAEILPKAGRVTWPSRRRRSEAGTLTRREREIVRLLGEGKTAKEVAGLLAISTKTVESHRANVGRKLHLRSLGDLIRYAIRNSLTKM